MDLLESLSNIVALRTQISPLDAYPTAASWIKAGPLSTRRLNLTQSRKGAKNSERVILFSLTFAGFALQWRRILFFEQDSFGLRAKPALCLCVRPVFGFSIARCNVLMA